MADEAKLCCPIRPTFEALVLQHVVRRCLGAELGPFYWPMLAAGIEVFRFLVHLISSLSILLGFTNGFARIQKAVMDQTSSRPPNSDHDLFLVQVWLWEVLWSFFSF